MYKLIINKTKNKLNNSFLKNIYRIKMTKNKIVLYRKMKKCINIEKVLFFYL